MAGTTGVGWVSDSVTHHDHAQIHSRKTITYVLTSEFKHGRDGSPKAPTVGAPTLGALGDPSYISWLKLAFSSFLSQSITSSKGMGRAK